MYFVTQVAPYREGPAGVHGVLDQAATAMSELARLSGLEPVHVADVSGLSPEDLGGAALLSLFTIGETPWSVEQRAAILSGVRSGRMSIVGLHAATDACRDWDEYGTLMGARFDGHPWTQDIEMDVLNHSHPATAHLGEAWRLRDEVYLFRDLRPDADVLIRVRDGTLDMSVEAARRPSCGFPLAWSFTEGSGRIFYTALGHFPSAWENPVFLRHVLGGITWARSG